jgi:hypothetical protein
VVQLLQRLSVFLGLLVVWQLLVEDSHAQSRVAQDSIVLSDSTGHGGELRPRRGTYIVETYPSPARTGQSIVIQYYNHNDQDLAVDIMDMNGRVVYVVQSRQLMPNGLHRLDLPSNSLASGVYHLRLRTFTPAGKADELELYRFMIVR